MGVDRLKIEVSSPDAYLPKDSVIKNVELDAEKISSGKVRDSFALRDGNRLLVSTDRISVFDVVLRDGIPNKGRVLNGVSAYNLLRTAKIVPNHLVAPCVDSGIGWLDDRAMVVKNAEPIKVEAVVRGYLTGSALRDYLRTGEMFGIKLPEGLKDGSELPEPIFTPTTKAEIGHDEPITFDQLEYQEGKALAKQIKDLSIELYSSIREDLLRKELVLADTKFEFGWLREGDGKTLILIDEVGTPDSSRYWSLGPYKQGILVNEDKEPVRKYCADTGWDKKYPAPPLPQSVISETSERYTGVMSKITREPQA